jgi:hypothetical protein
MHLIVPNVSSRYRCSMIADIELWACAKQLMEHHGAHALTIATRRADALLADGKLEGHRTFVLIVDRIRQLECLAPSGNLH